MNKRKFISILLAALMLVSCFSGVAAAKTTAEDNPFAALDAAYELSLTETAADYTPQASLFAATVDEHEGMPRTVIEFKASVSYADMARLLEPFDYELLGKSEWREFLIYEDIDVVKEALAEYAAFIEADERIYAADYDNGAFAADSSVFADANAAEGQNSAAKTPNDAYLSRQWAINALKLPGAWNITTGSTSVVVAVIDSGIYRAHDEFDNVKILNGYDYVKNTSKVSSDPCGHGTHTTSVIAAGTNNGIGIAGSCWKVTVMPLRTLDDKGSGWTSDSNMALRRAADSGVEVINMSLGGENWGSDENSAAQYALSKGCIIIAAAGNNGTSAYAYPASYSGVISVASVNSNLNHSYFSQYNNHVAVCAPGENIYMANNKGKYDYDDGTSFSTPYVAGICALAKAYYPELTRADFLSLIQTTSTDLGASGYDYYYGFGLINAQKMLETIREIVYKPVTGVKLSNTKLTLNVGGEATLKATVSPSDAANKKVSWSSSNTAVAKVSSAGKVTAIASGSATITVKTSDGGYTAKCAVTVKAPVTSITLSKTVLNMTAGDSASLTYTIKPSNATNKNVTWSSDNAAVATVSASGKVKAVSEGTAFIRVVTEDGAFAAATLVNVSPKIVVPQPTPGPIAVTGVYITGGGTAFYRGGSSQFSAMIFPTNASNRAVYWSSDNEAVAKVDATGLVTGISAGTANITVTTDDGGYTASVNVIIIDNGIEDGWQKDGMGWRYYLNGKALTGYQYLTGYQRGNKQGANLYYFDDNGVMITGFVKRGTSWYYFAETGSKPTSSTLGQMIKNYYVLDAPSGYKSAGEQAAGKSYYYYFDGSGAMYTGWYNNALTRNKWMYFGEDGSKPTGSRLGRQARYGIVSGYGNNGEQHSYFFTETGVMKTGTYTINGKKCVFNATGSNPATDLLGALK